MKRTGGLTAQELDLGKLCYQNSVFGVGRCIKGGVFEGGGGGVFGLRGTRLEGPIPPRNDQCTRICPKITAKSVFFV